MKRIIESIFTFLHSSDTILSIMQIIYIIGGYMINKKVRIAVYILMLSAVILSYRRFDGNPTLHIIAGSICALLFAIHFSLNEKTFKAYSMGIKKQTAKQS
jgi:hypothetical protein